MNRLEEVWKNEKRYKSIVHGGDDIILDVMTKMEKSTASQTSLREVILNRTSEGDYSMTQILTSIDCDTFDLVDAPILEKIYTEDDSNTELLYDIANYMGGQIPIYGNTEELQGELEELQFQIIKNGIKKDGKSYTLKEYNEIGIKHSDSILLLSTRRNLYPGEIRFFKELINSESEIDKNATEFIKSLKASIAKFENLLKSTFRNENLLQKFLTENPIFFGTEYKEIKVKPKLGGEYEMDYALVKFDGTYDLIEIESSNLEVFTKSGQPRNELIHAEQQVLDWIDWVEKNNPYAQNNLKNIVSPKGYVIIGRNINFGEEETRKLQRRNKSIIGLSILTYDDLLNKAKTLELLRRN
ncbi:MAG: DUF4263 domain-containing protein [Saprospiraceae bacterium]|nr:DUF4263 domain-containing protein [Saprospiraceae bacterium]